MGSFEDPILDYPEWMRKLETPISVHLSLFAHLFISDLIVFFEFSLSLYTIYMIVPLWNPTLRGPNCTKSTLSKWEIFALATIFKWKCHIDMMSFLSRLQC